MCKIAKVVPIFKSETGLLSNNYRPISLLSNIGKIIEKLIHLRLNLSLETCNSYYLFQFGFRLNLVELLAKKMDQDLKNLSQWLWASKLSLNVKKTELIIFHPKNTKQDYGVKFKLNGRRLTPISTVKYLEILLDEHLLWTKQVNWENSKLNQTIGILGKQRHNARLPILKIVYNSLFGSHLQYGTQLWGQGNCLNQNNIQNLQNRAHRKITFKKFHDPGNPSL